MAKLVSLPAQAIIDGFKGVIDFYVFRPSADPEVGMKGIPCARKWPVTPPSHRSLGEQVSWPAFAWSSSNWNSLSPYVQEAYRQTAKNSNLTARDLFTKSFISDYFREGQWP